MHGGRHEDLTHVFTAGFPVFVGDPPARRTLNTIAASDPDATVEVRDLRRLERRHGRIPHGALVFMHSGLGGPPARPRGVQEPGPDGKFHFRGWGADAVQWLLERRHITGIGVDTMSLDPGVSTTFDSHKRLLGADRYGRESVANLPHLPACGAQVIVGVIPWGEGSGGPCRLLATY
jgi:kynurenine formamidase